MTITSEQISQIISKYTDPYLKKDLISAKTIKKIDIHNSQINIEIVLGFPILGYREQLFSNLHNLLRTELKSEQINITVSSEIKSHAVQVGLKSIPGVKNIIA